VPRPPVVLCVDDDRGTLVASAHLLSTRGYDVIATDCAKLALGVLQEQGVDIIVTDYDMPGMNGAHFAARVKAEKYGKPILLRSGFLNITPSATRNVDALSPKGRSAESFLADVDALCQTAAVAHQADLNHKTCSVLQESKLGGNDVAEANL